MNNIRKYRNMLGLTREELADLVGVHKNTIAMWETKEDVEQHISYANSKKLANIFNIDTEDLFEKKNESFKRVHNYTKKKMIARVDRFLTNNFEQFKQDMLESIIEKF